MDGVVDVRGGRVRGERRRGTWSFSGIPYAGSPAGAARWRPPAPPEPWTGVRACDRFGPIAPQTVGVAEQLIGGEPEEQSEDCLTLNVWTPELDAARRPVMVWIHGGSFVTGSGSAGFYRGGLLAREQDVVVVTLNYRLGMLGFLAHPALEDPDQVWLDGRPWSGWGNWGLADQVTALRWVADHIADFGGDPGNVTIFGESAGGMSVSDLLAVPAATGLFHKAIAQSGPPYAHTADQAVKRAEVLARHLGVPLTRADLQAVPAARLLEAAAEVQTPEAGDGDAGLVLQPAVDGGLLPRNPAIPVPPGSGVPLLFGTNRDEFTLFAVGNPKVDAAGPADVERWVSRSALGGAPAGDLIDAVAAIRAGRGESIMPRDLWVAIATEYVFRLPAVRLADARARLGEPDAPTYAYYFTWESPAFGGVLQSSHALEIPFVFGTIRNPAIAAFAGGGEDALGLSAAMRRAWADFARTGAPDGWKTWDPDQRPVKVLGPWPGAEGLEHDVDRPRDEELQAVARAVPGPVG